MIVITNQEPFSIKGLHDFKNPLNNKKYPMSVYYKANRTRNVYDPEKAEAFKLSRSKISLFLNCPRCFYLDRRLGIGRPPGFPFNLNSAVDALLKKEFDLHRAKEKAHPLMEKYGIDAVPFQVREWMNGGIHCAEASNICIRKPICF